MSCPKNIQTFLFFFESEGPCDWKDTYVTASSPNKKSFHVSQQCRNCKSFRELIYVKPQDMIRAGFDITKLNAIPNQGCHHPEQLK